MAIWLRVQYLMYLYWQFSHVRQSSWKQLAHLAWLAKQELSLAQLSPSFSLLLSAATGRIGSERQPRLKGRPGLPDSQSSGWEFLLEWWMVGYFLDLILVQCWLHDSHYTQTLHAAGFQCVGHWLCIYCSEEIGLGGFLQFSLQWGGSGGAS